MSAFTVCKKLVCDAFDASLILYKVMIPVIILVKILQEYNMVQYLALPLKPIMGLVGLPAEMGLVLATSIVVNLYSAVAVYASMITQIDPLTVAQASVLGAMMVMAHALPVECKVAQQCGVSFSGQVVIRLFSSLALGVFMHLIYTHTGTLQEPSSLLWSQPEPAPGLLPWAIKELKNLGMLYCIILALFTVMKVLTHFGFVEKLNSLLKPVLKIIGIGEHAATLTVIGLSIGINYGGGLIIPEVQSGTLSKRDIYASMTLMGLAHALIEETLIVMMLGADSSATLWGRLLFSLCFVGVLMRFYSEKKEFGVTI